MQSRSCPAPRWLTALLRKPDEAVQTSAPPAVVRRSPDRAQTGCGEQAGRQLFTIRDERSPSGKGLDQSFRAKDVQGVTDGTAGYAVLSHQVCLGWDRLTWLKCAGFDRMAQDRCQLKVQRRCVEMINRHAVTVTDQPERV